jgi:DNA-binding CsgD family transcriptional regulator
MNRVQATQLARFLTVIGQSEEPDTVCRYVATTALQPIPTRGVTMYAADDDRGLALVGSYGIPPALMEPYRYITLNLPMPLVTAFTENRKLHLTDAEEESAYPIMTGPHRDIVRESWGAWEFVAMPLALESAPLGLLVIVFEPFRWQADHWLVLDGIAAATAMWLRTRGYPQAGRHPRVSLDAATTLTDRQLAVLTLMADGASNPDIAARLSISVSLVKQEVGRILRLLDCHDREGAARKAAALGLLPA